MATCDSCPQPEPPVVKAAPVCQDLAPAEFEEKTKGMFKKCAEAKAAGMCEKAGDMCAATFSARCRCLLPAA